MVVGVLKSVFVPLSNLRVSNALTQLSVEPELQVLSPYFVIYIRWASHLDLNTIKGWRNCRRMRRKETDAGAGVCVFQVW